MRRRRCRPSGTPRCRGSARGRAATSSHVGTPSAIDKNDGTGAAGSRMLGGPRERRWLRPLLVSASSSSSCSPSTPFLNSLLACPRDLASFGSRVLPKRRRTTARMMSSSGAPRFMRNALSRESGTGYRGDAHGCPCSRGWRQQFDVVERGHRERHRARTHDDRLDPEAVPPGACSRICSTVPTSRPTRHSSSVVDRAPRAG